MRKFRYYILLSLSIFSGLVIFSISISKNSVDNTANSSIIIHGHRIRVEVADTPSKRSLGLSYRKSLDKSEGMLFLFSQKSYYTFWMKDMKFPLDFVWIDDTKVVGLDKNAPPEGDSPQNIYSPEKPVNKVLEISSGAIDMYNIKIGDRVKFINIK